jgi:glycosyltransferase involved in cell wall biosynthesis
MNIVLTHPYCWPYVRRGNERFIDGLGRYLTSRHHTVTTVSARPGSYAVEVGPQGTRVLYPPWWSPWLGKLRIQPTHTFFFSCLHGLSRLSPQVVHSFYFTDAAAAQRMSRGRYKTVLQINGAPVPGAFHRLPPDRHLVRRVIRGTDVLIVCSRFVRDVVLEHYGREAHVIVPPVDTAAFPVAQGERSPRPLILSVADFDQRNKGVRALVKAFALLKQELPDALLRLSGRMSEATRNDAMAGLPEAVRRDVECLGLGDPGDLPRLYQQASVMVLPSMWEASGYSMFEAWLSGTPVVATAHGGLPEFVRDDVGVLFDPRSNGQEIADIEGLAAAIKQGLALAQRPETRGRCRAFAESYGWERAGTLYDPIYQV